MRPLLLVVALVFAGSAQADQPAETEAIYHGEATSILGRPVHDPAGDAVGRIVDVLVDEQGQPRAGVIDFGGFMGVGNRHIAVAWRALHFQPTAGRGQILLEMTADQIKAIPDYKRAPRPEDPPLQVAAPPTAGDPGHP
ncbi:MAG: hypothetical protein NVSMB18_04930 [Acetobacteraceae bacterium]